MPCDLRFAGSLTDVQQRGVLAYEERLASAANPKGSIVVLPCGYGKTVFALYLAARLGRRTLVLVHKAFLVEQWQARVRQFLSGASVGVVQQGRVESNAMRLMRPFSAAAKLARKAAFEASMDRINKLAVSMLRKFLLKFVTKRTFAYAWWWWQGRRRGWQCGWRRRGQRRRGRRWRRW